MGLHEVKAAISEKTDAEVAAIIHEGETQAASIIAEAQAQVEQKKQAHSAKTAEIIAVMQRKEQTGAQFAAKAIILDEKRKAIDAALRIVKTKLDEQSTLQRKQLLANLVNMTKEEISIKEVRCAAKDVKALAQLLPEAIINADDNISGGFIAESTDGSLRIDHTYETLLQTNKEEHLPQLTQILFP